MLFKTIFNGLASLYFLLNVQSGCLAWADSGAAERPLPADFSVTGADKLSSLGKGKLLAIKKAANCILGRQTTDGAIFVGPTFMAENKIVPYYSNFAASALCQAYQESGDIRYRRAALAWARWYASHLNPDGTVYDYDWKDGVLKSTGTYDSTDSYAATYLDALLALDDAGADIREFWPVAQRVKQAIDLTLQNNGLTWATPTYPVQYLMDNVEVRRGLLSASELARRFEEDGLAAAWEAQAMRVQTAISQSLYLPKAHRYAYALEGDVLSSEPGVWYPDTMAMLMTIAWMPSSAEHQALYRALRGSLFNVHEILNDQDGENAMWWGLAAIAAEDHPTVALISKYLRELDFEKVTLRDASQYAYLITILSK